MSADEFTADQLEEVFHAALAAGDAKGVEAALLVMTTVDPYRAGYLYETLEVALAVASGLGTVDGAA